MKHQVLFSSKDKSKRNLCRLLQIFIWCLKVNLFGYATIFSTIVLAGRQCDFLFLPFQKDLISKESLPQGKLKIHRVASPESIAIHLSPIALRKAKIVCNFGLSECNRVKYGDKHTIRFLSFWHAVSSYRLYSTTCCYRTCPVQLDHDLILTLKAPITTAADNIHKYFFIVFQRK